MNLFTKGHISQSLSRLLKRHLITMKHDADDKRFSHIFLTTDAKIILDEADRAAQNIDAVVLQGLSPKEQETLLHAAQIIHQNIVRAMEKRRMAYDKTSVRP